MKLGKKLAFITAAAITATTLASVAFATEIPVTESVSGKTINLVSQSDTDCKYELTADGFRQYDLEENYKSFVIPFSETGIKLDSTENYLVTFTGKVADVSQANKKMVIQLRGLTDDSWIGARRLDGVKINDDSSNGLSINDDGTFSCSGYFSGDNELAITEKGRTGYDYLCVWGQYKNNPTDYTIYSVTIEECDASGVATGAPVFNLSFAATEAEEAVVEETPAEVATEEPASNETVTTAAPAVTAAATTTTAQKGSPDTGIAGIAGITAVAILAGGAVIVSKKRK